MIPLHPGFLTQPLAHRGFHDVAKGRPENSRAAISAALDAGYGIEIDVQLSADDQAMVFHDYALDRLTSSTGMVRAQTKPDLKTVPLTGGDETIPDLAEILDLVNGQVPLVIEIKDQSGDMGPDVGPLEEATAAVVHGYKGPLALMSFNPHSVACLAKIAPDIPRGLVTSDFIASEWPELTQARCDELRHIPDFDRVGASFVSHQANQLDNPRLGEIKASGGKIWCWTIKSEAQERQARNVAENITFEGYAATLP